MRPVLTALFVLAASALPAAGTLTVDTRGWTGTGETNGWTYSQLDTPYADQAAKFRIDTLLASPVWPDVDITGITVDLRCSSTAADAKKLQITLLHDGRPVSQPVLTQSVTKEAKRESQSFPVDRALHANGFSLSLSGSGNTGVWGVYAVMVESVGSLRPFDLRTARVGSTTFTAAWRNSDTVLSNEVVVVRTNGVPFSAVYAHRHDFDAVSNPGGNPKDLSKDLPDIGEDLSGERVYAPTNSSGIIQIGTGDFAGWLRCHRPPDPSANHLVIQARRYVSSKEGRSMTVRSIYGSETNDLGVVALEDELKTYDVDLSGTPLDSSVLLSSSKQTNGRVIVDAIGFATSVVPAHTETNRVSRTPCAGVELKRIEGLRPLTDYLWSVRGFDGTDASPFPDYLPFRTGEGTGLVIQFN